MRDASFEVQSRINSKHEPRIPKLDEQFRRLRKNPL